MSPSKGNLSQLKDFLGYLSTVKGDVSNVTAPPFVLSTKSTTEIPASWAEHHTLFNAPAKESDPANRALAVLKNFLCSLKRQTYTGRSEAEGIKKPLNAFLGELFIATLEDDAGTTRLISEQVSHHPPVTACYLVNEKSGTSAEGYVSQETTVSASHGVSIKQIGYAIIRLEEYDESHLMTLPTLTIKGLLTGSPYPELEGECKITTSSGFTSTISFEGKKMLGMSGKKNTLDAILVHDNKPDEPLYEVTGQWNTALTITDCKTKKVLEEIVIDDLKVTPLQVAPEAQQDSWESRRAWGPTIKAIESGEMKAVSDEKSKIEEAQRVIRKAEGEAKKEWPRLFFTRQQEDPEAEALAKKVGLNVQQEKERTDGIWRFVGHDAAEGLLKGSFHAGLTPLGQVEASNGKGA